MPRAPPPLTAAQSAWWWMDRWNFRIAPPVPGRWMPAPAEMSMRGYRLRSCIRVRRRRDRLHNPASASSSLLFPWSRGLRLVYSHWRDWPKWRRRAVGRSDWVRGAQPFHSLSTDLTSASSDRPCHARKYRRYPVAIHALLFQPARWRRTVRLISWNASHFDHPAWFPACALLFQFARRRRPLFRDPLRCWPAACSNANRYRYSKAPDSWRLPPRWLRPSPAIHHRGHYSSRPGWPAARAVTVRAKEGHSEMQAIRKCPLFSAATPSRYRVCCGHAFPSRLSLERQYLARPSASRRWQTRDQCPSCWSRSFQIGARTFPYIEARRHPALKVQ